MHHFPVSKGDSLCPLGFHPQVRWPTRCKRCFRDYKEHYNRKKEEDKLRKDLLTGSTPSISSSSRSDYPRSWASSDNLFEGKLDNELTEYKSTLDLVNLDNNSTSFTTVSLRLPKRRTNSKDQEVNRITANDNEQNFVCDKSSLIKDGKDISRVQIKEVKSISNGPTNNDVQFVIQVKKKPGKIPVEEVENRMEHRERILNSDIENPSNERRRKLEATEYKLSTTKHGGVPQRIPSMDSSDKQNLELNKPQDKSVEQKKENNEQKSNISSKVHRTRISEDKMKRYPEEKSTNTIDEFKSKLKAAETLCEELMDENEALKKDVRDMEEQIDEMQDNFREDQIAEYTSLKAELEQTTKNCRILSFKLRKAEKRNEQLEVEKHNMEKRMDEFSEKQTSADNLEKIKKLEQELLESSNISTKFQTEINILNEKLRLLESSKSSMEVSKCSEMKRISRQSLIRSSSQEEPIIQVQVLNSSEMERDLREQLRFSEEEAENLRKTITRIENDNEILLQQLKKLNSRVQNKFGKSKDILDEDLKLQLDIPQQKISLSECKSDMDKSITKSQVVLSKKVSEDKVHKKLLEYEQQIKALKTNIEEQQNENAKSSTKWETQSKKLNFRILTLEQLNEGLVKTIKENEATICKLEKKIAGGKIAFKTAQTVEIDKLKTEVELKKTELETLKIQLNTIKKDEEELRWQLKNIQSEKETADQESTKRAHELETDLKGERKKVKLLKKETETKNSEIISLKLQISKLDIYNDSTLQIKIDEMSELNKKISADLQESSTRLKDLSAKHEDLEEEFSLTKANMDVEKEKLNNELQTMKQRLNNIIWEKKELQEEFTKERNNWFREESKQQEKFNMLSSLPNGNSDLDKKRYNSVIAEKHSELEKFKKENESLTYQIDYMKKESDEIKRKLDDYEKVNKIQRNMSADTSAMEREVRTLKIKLETLENSRKAEILKCKMSYEEQLARVNNEMKLLQHQIVKYKREKDTYKSLLQSGPKGADSKFRRELSNGIEVSNIKGDTLEAQLCSLEDELSETKLEYSKLKTELVSDKSNYEVKILQMQTRINELEEEKILNSGRTKIAGLRTRMELSWQKEREEQQRLIQETATLSRDLRQTLFEVEKERDKERLEAKRKFEQFRRAIEEERIEDTKKIKDLQCDLLELRDAHAKLRTTNERLKREKERSRRDEDLRAKSLSRSDLDDTRDISSISRHIDTLQCLANEFEHFDEKKKNRSMATDDKKEKLDNVVSSLLTISQELFSQMKMMEREKLMMPRRTRPPENSRSKVVLNNPAGLKRRSLSLEQTSINPREPNIWHANNDSMSSLRSANSDLDVYDNYSDSSAQSDFTVTKKKKRGIIGQIKKMTKSKSMDEGESGIFSSLLGRKPNSLENLNNTITGIFRRSGSSSRGNSMERTKPQEVKNDSSSRQRPLMKMNSESPAR